MHSGVVVELQVPALRGVQLEVDHGLFSPADRIVARALNSIEPAAKLRRFFDLYPSMADITVRLADYFADLVPAPAVEACSLFERCFRSALHELSKCRFYRNSVAFEDMQVAAYLYGLLRHVDDVLDVHVTAVLADGAVIWPSLDMPISAWRASVSGVQTLTVQKIASCMTLDERNAARYCIIAKLLSQHDLVAIGGSLCEFDRAPSILSA
ncbi:hypothetical protein [Duganella vulcania]|uniref:Uncharacterized protein n=1 Tax=Duganella vulcania TaxID=2692166 RepID=A0A845GH23_9BURK|nr:hypothetical protein [Duganella vulcania]MYM92705.1 hypothetical protein [Duganella vulcania]